MGKITKIEIQKKNKERVNIFIDEEYAFSLFLDLVYREDLRKGMDINEEKLKNIAQKENKLKCKSTALRIIERSNKTEKQIRDKLLEKDYDLDSITQAIEFLKEYKFIDDYNYARCYIKDKIKAQGSRKIKYSLIQKGINKDIVEELLSDVDRELEKDVAIEIARKKYLQITKRENEKFKIWNKLSGFLVSKGYDYSLVKSVVKEIVEAEVWE